MATVDPEDIVNVIKAQHNWLSKLQEADRMRPIKIKVIEGEMPKGSDPDLYNWTDLKQFGPK